MTETLSGTVTVVESVVLGDILASSVSIGAASLTVEDAAYFSEAGGTLRIGGDDPAAQILAYTAADPATAIITLASTVAAAWPAATPVDMWDPATSAVFVEYRALIELPGSVDNADVLDCVISHALIPLLPQGIRDPGEGESVTVTSNGGEWTVVDILGRTPSFDGGRITPATITPLQVTFTTSGKDVTIGNTAPVSPHTGDLWYDGNNGYQLNQWSGSAWVPFQFGTNAIAAGSVTADLVAANAIVAGAIAAGALDAQTITAGTLTAGAVSAGSIGASQILASDITDCDITVDPDGGTVLIYALSGQTTVNLTTAGASTFSVPAGVSNLDRVECWGGSGGGEGSAGTFGGCGGAAGEYAREDNIAVTPLASIPYTVGAAGAAGATSGAAAGNGGDTVFNSTVVVAHGGLGGGTYGPGISVPGATGSTNTVHFSGGAGHAAGGTFGTLGGGGGSSGGSTRSGNSGGAGTNPTTGGVGGSAVTDGGAGGNGGNGGGTGAVGSAGLAPGGGGGGAGAGSTPRTGGAGAAGKIRIKYGGARVLVASLAGVAGTDIYGNSYPAGIRTNTAVAAGLSGGYYEELTIPATRIDSATTVNLKASATTRLTSDYGSAYNMTTGQWTAPADGVYDIEVGLSGSTFGATAARAFIDFSSATLSGGTIYQRNQITSLPSGNWETSAIMTRYFTSGTTVFVSARQDSGNAAAAFNTIATRNNTLMFTRRG